MVIDFRKIRMVLLYHFFFFFFFLTGTKLSSWNLQALREYYGIPLVGTAHRAMSDVNLLSLVLQKMTFDLKLTVSALLDRSFMVSKLTQVSDWLAPPFHSINCILSEISDLTYRRTFASPHCVLAPTITVVMELHSFQSNFWYILFWKHAGILWSLYEHWLPYL